MQSIDKPKKCLYATRGERVSSVDRVFQQGKSNSELFVLSCNSLSFLSSKIEDITNKGTATMWRRRKKRIRGKRKKFEWIIPIISEEWLEFRENFVPRILSCQFTLSTDIRNLDTIQALVRLLQYSPAQRKRGRTRSFSNNEYLPNNTDIYLLFHIFCSPPNGTKRCLILIRRTSELIVERAK